LKPGQQQTHELFLPNFCGMRMVFVIVIIAQLFAFVLALAPLSQPSDLRWQNLGLISLFVQWCALGTAAVLCLIRPWLRRFNNTQTAVLSYLVMLTVIGLISEAAYWLTPKVDVTIQQHWQFLIRNLVIGAIISGPVLRYFYVQHQWRRRIEAESQARLQALQSRIRPHFLFNSMNTIASLTRSNPEQAEMAVENLSDLFRASLSDATQRFTLKEELELCRRYIQIECLRIGEERLKVNWQTDTLPTDALIPPLTLQPLLENAIYHGIESLTEGGVIDVIGSIDKKHIEIRLINPLPVTGTSSPNHGNQLAQENIRERLQAFYQRKADIQLNEADHSYEVVLNFPYVTQSDEDTDR
jgi:two-component system sensor histidine kinase AlgZ